MNIDVREYLRINPISVHDLTLSDNDNDCFLFFPSNMQTDQGYKAFTQSQLFMGLQKSILGGLLDDNEKIKASGVSEEDIDGKLINYVRKSAAQGFMQHFDQQLEELESGLDDIILALRRKGILDYAGAVELQSSRTRKLDWTSGMGGPLYRNMSYAEGQIWCKSTDSNIPISDGSDEATIGNEPLRHIHQDTMAETLTGPLARNFGGGQIIGDLTIGVKEFLDQAIGYGPTTDIKISPVPHLGNERLTYPLWGQNVLDWRNPKKEHNNIPPSLNIYVRFWNEAQASIREIVASEEACSDMIKRVIGIQEKKSAAEAQYQSSMVKNLAQYSEQNLSPSDSLLRILSNDECEVQLMRQGIQMFLDIFASRTNDNLSTEDKSMKELLMGHLDTLLFQSHEFMRWCHEKFSKLDEIEGKIQTARDLIVSVPPLNYIGRIIISYTDDTEQKVIANYGGKSWRRIENFLRGVKDISTIPIFNTSNEYQIGDLVRYNNIVYVFIQHHRPGAWDESHVKEHDITIDIPGRKLGEEYVALRESNVPIHQHSEILSESRPEINTQNQDWASRDRGSSKILNSATGSRSVEVARIDRNYQMSPLEYPNKGEDEITLPHDNLPPYMKMYIWECVELTEEEYAITGEPKEEPLDKHCVITWLKNNGADPQKDTYVIGNTIGNAPVVSRSNYDFKGWKCPDGRIADKKQNGTVGQPVYIGDTVLGNSFYIAQWKPTKYTVTFNGNGGSPGAMTRKYAYGEQIGYFPTFDEYPDGAIGLSGWKTENGQSVNETYEVKSDMTLIAQWNIKVPETVTVNFYKYDGNRYDDKTRTLEKGAKIGELDNQTRTGYAFKGWFTETTGGVQVSATKRVYSDLNLYEQWIADTCAITWNPNYSGGTSSVQNIGYGSQLGTLPVVARKGYAFNGWFTETTGGEEISSNTTVEGTATYYAHWTPVSYTISYVLNGGIFPSSATPPDSYTIETETITISSPTYPGRTFIGWTGSNGNSPQNPVLIPEGSTGNKNYVANWDADTYIVMFDKNNEQASGSMPSQIFTYDVYQKLRNNEFADSIVVHFDGNGGYPAESSLTSHREFLGWATSQDGVKVYDNQQNVKNLTTGNDITLYAKWGSWSNIYLPNANRTGYTLHNWYDSPTEESEDGKIGGAGDPYQPTETTTLYAHWKKSIATITFDANGGNCGVETMEKDIGDVVGDLPEATYPNAEGLAGMEFQGWYTGKEGGTKVTGQETITGNATYYAHWQGVIHYRPVYINQGNHQITIDSNGVASGFYGNAQPSNIVQCALESIPDDKFDFSGEFDIVMKCQVKENRNDINCSAVLPNYGEYVRNCSSWDVFGAYYVNQDTYNHFCDFGLLMDAQGTSNIKYTQWEIASNKNDSRILGPYYEPGTRINQSPPSGWATQPFLLGVQRRYIDNKWVIRTYLSMDDGQTWTLERENANAMQPLTASKFCIGNDSDSYSEYFPGAIFLNECYLVQRNTQSAQPCGKYILRGATIVKLSATIDVSNNTATCTNVYPSDAIVKYRKNGVGDILPGSSFTLDFTPGQTETQFGQFILQRAGSNDVIYKVTIKQTYTASGWGEWSDWAGPTTFENARAYIASLNSQYGTGNVDTDQTGTFGQANWYVKFRIREPATTKYESWVEEQ